MLFRRRLFHLLALLLVLSIILVACERPIPGGETDVTVTDTGNEAAPDTNVGGGEPTATTASSESVPETAPEPTEAGESDTPRVEEEATATPVPASEETAAEPTAESESSAETAESAETSAETTAEETAEIPQTHTVAAGENLYRIGLKYGISWVTLAKLNNLPNPNVLKVGQVIKLTNGEVSQGQADATSTPSPLTETTYIVKPGDNLYRIGLAYGISWVQIAEANGIVNPNQIKVNQELKIPVDRPGPTPQFTHVVKAGDTLFLISLRYGVPWTSIAKENGINSPYVIYVGQTLVIPGE